MIIADIYKSMKSDYMMDQRKKNREFHSGMQVEEMLDLID